MKYCRICGEKLEQKDFLTGTCEDCEAAVAKLIIQKIVKGVIPKRSRVRLT